MAKYEKSFKGDFENFLNLFEEEIIRSSSSASYEDGSDYNINGVRCAVRVYERYSFIGKNRVSLNTTLLGNGEDLFFTAITSGGSQALFMKINTIGENSFLEKAVKIIERYIE